MSDFKKNRNLIWELSKNDFKKRYAGSSLGRVWAFVQPLVTVVLYYFVFGLVFPGRSPYDSPVPYVMWLTAGLVPWFFLNEAVTTGANAMNEYNYLVKKVVFKVGGIEFTDEGPIHVKCGNTVFPSDIILGIRISYIFNILL